MLISASVRPRNVKRGITTKRICTALGYPEEVGLTKVCGRLELSAEAPAEFKFLRDLFNCFSPIKDTQCKITIEINGEKVGEYNNRA